MADDSMRTVLVALGSGLAVALAKVGVAAVTGSAGQMIHRGRRFRRGHLRPHAAGRVPRGRGIVSGDVVTFAALGLNQLTGSSVYQGVAAVLIGLALIRVSLRLIKRSHDFLVGAWLVPVPVDDFTQPLSADDDEERLRAFLWPTPG